MKNVTAITFWCIVLMIVITVMCSLLTYPSTVANIVGFLGMVGFILLSVKTKCFTSISLTNKKKDESNEK